jgi:hypothetical protein
MRFAEKKCRKLAMGSVDFSPEVDLARRRRWVWQQVVKIREGKRVSASLVKRKARQCGIVCPLSVTLAQAKERFATAHEEYRNLKAKAPWLRQEFLLEIATNKSGEETEASQKAARRLIQQERQRSDARHLRRVLAKTQGGAISKIEVLEGGEYVEKTTQAEVEHHTMAMCCARFRLTENTPLRQEPFYTAFGPLATNTAAARTLLNGTYTIPEGTDVYTREFLNTLQAHAPRDPQLRISCEITKEDFQHFWRKQKE